MSLKFGLSLPQGLTMELAHLKDPVEAYETMTQVARVADEVGFESLWLFDHFHTFPRSSQEMTFECWTATAALARDTKRIRIGQMVTCNGYRHPALLAKMASTVDVLSHGRLNFGIGAGALEPEYRAYGYDYPETSARLRQLREAVQVILAMWTQEEAAFEGNYYQVRGAINQPKGVQKPHVPLLIGGGGEHVTLKLVAQYGDACNVSGSLETIQHKFDVLKKHCEAIGRNYESIHRTVTLSCMIGETDEQAEAKVPPGLRSYAALRASILVGSPDTLRKRLIELEEAGVQEIILRFSDALNLDTLRFFAKELIA
ncbi:MAG TPA: LLM class F420-dependent oxidoreductase [Ktedonobacteraceae bacterium]|jgi:F420-dependent oxidoreductase-like protein|nr:LLM class F420-dependent oxidoreductase [Ktedonobacteraceae bacterium]